MPFITSVAGTFGPIGRIKRPPNTASGGTKTTDGVYNYHSFTGNSTFTANFNGSVDVYIVSGGGGGSGAYASLGQSSSGAGGGIIVWQPVSVSYGVSNSVTVGGGGGGNGQSQPPTAGGTSTFLTQSTGSTNQARQTPPSPLNTIIGNDICGSQATPLYGTSPGPAGQWTGNGGGGATYYYGNAHAVRTGSPGYRGQVVIRYLI